MITSKTTFNTTILALTLYSCAAHAQDQGPSPSAPRSSDERFDDAAADLESDDGDEWRSAVHGLRLYLGQDNTGRLLRAATTDPDPAVRLEAVDLLRQVSSQLRHTLERSRRNDPDLEIRRVAEGASPGTPAPGDGPPSSATRGRDDEESIESRMERARRIQYAGWTTFIAGYVGALIPGLIGMTEIPELAWVSLIPLTGPAFVSFGGGLPVMEIFSMFYIPCLAAQLTGFISLVAGHRMARPDYEPRRRRRGRSRGARSWGVAVAPSGAGVSVAGWFR